MSVVLFYSTEDLKGTKGRERGTLIFLTVWAEILVFSYIQTQTKKSTLLGSQVCQILNWNFQSQVKEESEKVGLKLNIQKTKIMASGPITSWQIDEETMETVTEFILGGSKITADGVCSREIKDVCSLEERLRPIQTTH